MTLPRVIVHRGAAGLAPENTLAGIRAAAAAGASGVEFDVKLTADGHCIAFHDDRLDRTTDGRGAVAKRTLAEIARLDAGAYAGPAFAGERVPSLAAVLDQALALGLAIDMEIKPSPGREAETAHRALAEARRAWPPGTPPPLVTSFSEESLMVARDAAPDWPRGLNCLAVPGDWRTRLDRLGSATLACLHKRLRRPAVAAMRGAGVSVLAFTVDEPGRAVELFSWGVQTVITDVPDTILAAT